MKKLLSILCLTAALSGTAYSEGFNIKLGGSVSQKIDKSVKASLDFSDYLYSDSVKLASKKVDIDPGFNIDISYDFKYSEKVDFGLGVIFNSDIKAKNSTDKLVEDYKFIPVFLQAKWNFDRNNYMNPYIIAKGGVTLFNLDSDYNNYDESAGYYYAFGAGIEVGNFLIEAVFEGLNASYNLDSLSGYSWEYGPYEYSLDMDLDYTRITLKAGMNFGRSYKKRKDEEENKNNM